MRKLNKTALGLLPVALMIPLVSCNRDAIPADPPANPIEQWHEDPESRYKVLDEIDEEIRDLSKDAIVALLGELDYYISYYRDNGLYVSYGYYKTTSSPRDNRLYYIVFTEGEQVKRTFRVFDESAAGDNAAYFYVSNDFEGDFR